MNKEVWIPVVSAPCRDTRPACRSSALHSFSSRVERRVHDADSYEHQAVPSVVHAMISAITGSSHAFGFDSLAAPPVLAVRALILRSAQRQFRDDVRDSG